MEAIGDKYGVTAYTVRSLVNRANAGGMDFVKRSRNNKKYSAETKINAVKEYQPCFADLPRPFQYQRFAFRICFPTQHLLQCISFYRASMHIFAIKSILKSTFLKVKI